MIWTITILSIIGTVLNIKKRPECFAIWAVTNAAWAIIDFSRGLPEQGVLFSVYFCLAVWGLVEWCRRPAI